MSDDVKSTPAAPRGKSPAFGLLVLLILIGVPGYGVFNWFFCRIEIPKEHVGILIAKTGENLASGQIIATEKGQKGIQLEVLKPGRHFKNPLFWDWEIEPFITIHAQKVGVLTRLYGENPSDQAQNLLVPMDTDGGHFKGIVREVLKPGQYPLNPYAYSVEEKPAVTIPAGYVGVKCNMVGQTPENANTYLVKAGERGVQAAVLGQGDHYLNPYEQRVYLVDIRSQRLEFADSEDEGATSEKDTSALHFPSSDGFEIEVRLTVEWSIDRGRAPEVFVRIGTGDPKTLLEEVLDKTLVPALRGNARISGSKYPAHDYIAGESRAKFQDAIFDSLKSACEKQGIVIHSVLVNDIDPPQDIASPIRDRQVAKEELARNKTQLKQAQAEQSLARQTELVDQEKSKVLAETEQKRKVIKSDNDRAVALIEQEQKLAVAKAELAAAKLEAEAILSRGKADATVIVAQNDALAEALRASVAAFGTPRGFASYTFANRVAPGVRTIFASPDGPFGDLFRNLIPSQSGKGGAR
jgi:regulator of protease activity HflC (stomatin/prohibitin superfamily)